MTADSVLRRSRFVFEEPGEKQVIIITDIRHEVLMRCATSSDVSLKVRLNFRLEKLRRVIWPKQGKVCTCNQMFKNIWFMVKRPWNKALYGDNVLKRTHSVFYRIRCPSLVTSILLWSPLYRDCCIFVCMKNKQGVHVFRLFIWVHNSACPGNCWELYTDLLVNREWGHYRELARSIHQGRGLRFPCNDRKDEVNKWFIMWPVQRYS